MTGAPGHRGARIARRCCFQADLDHGDEKRGGAGEQERREQQLVPGRPCAPRDAGDPSTPGCCQCQRRTPGTGSRVMLSTTLARKVTPRSRWISSRLASCVPSTWFGIRAAPTPGTHLDLVRIGLSIQAVQAPGAGFCLGPELRDDVAGLRVLRNGRGTLFD